MIGGTVAPITAGLRPAEAWSACGERIDAGQKEPIAAMTRRQDAATAAAAARGRIPAGRGAIVRKRTGTPRYPNAAPARHGRLGPRGRVPVPSGPDRSGSRPSGAGPQRSSGSGARIAF